ncbi:hypothetical protein EXIGLDRAFT_771937 [Exidia glandulosa HHB12029]|uniref:F-box domain-containing protein n=1 Tax=Exidia glandulosa HHB12029 TaxID=1314781 RepID=A0A165FM98_EXIGL|nr:hypothetical protein EXIGLDRAFT_771937 [Exidia glandulosa HHB12029]
MLEEAVSTRISAQLLQCNSADDAEQFINSFLLDALCAMRMSAKKWNDQHFNTCLPPEVLCQCFTFLTQDERRTAMCVSHHWRSVIIEEPRFWTRPVLSAESDVAAFHEIVKRAGTLPLHLVVRGAARAAEICQYMHRAVSLDVDGRMNAVPGLDLVLAATAPRLTAMTLKEHSVVLTIPQTLLYEQPVLRSLRIDAFILPPQCSALRQLREFDGYLDKDNFETSNIQSLFDLCPELDSLVLRTLLIWIDDSITLLPSRPAPSLSSLSLHIMGDGADLRPHLRRIESHVIPNVSLNISAPGYVNQRYLLERFRSFHSVSIAPSSSEFTPGYEVMDIQVDEDPMVERRSLCLAGISLYVEDMLSFVREDNRFKNVTVLTVWHTLIYTLFSGSCPQLLHLRTLNVVAPHRINSGNDFAAHGDPGRAKLADLTYPWTHIISPDEINYGVFDFPLRPITSLPHTYRFPALCELALYTVHRSPRCVAGDMPYIRLAALCNFLSREIDMNAPPLRRTFLLKDIDIAEPLVSSHCVEIANVFEEITFSNVSFGVAGCEIIPVVPAWLQTTF